MKPPDDGKIIKTFPDGFVKQYKKLLADYPVCLLKSL
jgi:hypothetical protein